MSGTRPQTAAGSIAELAAYYRERSLPELLAERDLIVGELGEAIGESGRAEVLGHLGVLDAEIAGRPEIRRGLERIALAWGDDFEDFRYEDGLLVCRPRSGPVDLISGASEPELNAAIRLVWEHREEPS